VADARGGIRCSRPTFASASSAELAEFVSAPATDETVVGSIQAGANPTPFVAHSLRDASGARVGLVGLALDLRDTQRWLPLNTLHERETMTIIDASGAIVVQTGDPERWVGRNITDVPFAEKLMGSASVAEARGLDGELALHALAFSAIGQWRIIVSVPFDVAYAQVNDSIARNVLLALAVVFAGALSAGIAIRQIESPLKKLIASAHALVEGNDPIRVAPGRDRELDELALALNQLIMRRGEAIEQLQQSAARYRDLFENSRDALFVVDFQGEIVDANAAAQGLTGYALNEIRRAKALDLMPLDERESRGDRLRRYQEMQGARESILVTRHGDEMSVEVVVTPITYQGEIALLAAARDMSERRRIEERLVRLSQRILTLNEAGLRMQATFDQQEILDIVGEELRNQNFDCLLAFLTAKQEHARVHYVSNMEWSRQFYAATRMDLIGYAFPLVGAFAKDIVARQKTFTVDAHPILESGLPLHLRDAACAVFDRFNLSRAIAAPLLVDRSVTAILIVAGADIQDVDTTAIAAFAQQAGVTLENARLYMEATRNAIELSTLNHIAAIVNRSLDLPAVLDTVLTQCRSLVDYDCAALFLNEGMPFRIALARGYPPEDDPARRYFEPDVKLYERLQRTHEALIVPDANACEYFAPQDMRLPASWMAVPIFALGELIGYLSLHKQTPGYYDVESVHRARAFAQITGSAIQNARLFDRERRTLKDLSALNGITEVGLSLLQPEELLYELIRRVVDSTGAAAGVIMLLEKGEQLVTRAVVGLDAAAIGYTQQVGQGFAGRIAERGEPDIIDNAQIDRTVQNPFVRAAQIKTLLGVPLKTGDEVVGVAHIDFKTVRKIEKSEITRFEVMADRAARAIENAQLVERISAYAEELEERVNERTQELALATAKAQEADKLKSQLLSIVSHELRTPLASIKGYVTTLISHLDRLQAATQIEFLQIVDLEADRLTELVENLLDMSRIEGGVLRIHPEPTPLTPVLERALAVLQPKLVEHQVDVQIYDALPDVLIDPSRIQQVLCNLLDNAAKYAPAGSPISISVDSGDLYVTLCIQDQGPGISPDHEEKVFDRFYRIEDARIRNTGGIGLGLPISRALIEAHGGRLWLKSETGQGSRFYFTLPIVQLDDNAPASTNGNRRFSG
jgi:PAS domain S-box-containing protein